MASDIYPILHRFLTEKEFAKTLKKFEKETSTGEEAAALDKAAKKRAKAIRKLELTAACQLHLDAQTDGNAAALVASEIRHVVHRFLLESGLAKSLKAFEKETSTGEYAAPVAPAVNKVAKKRAKAARALELTASCQLMLNAMRPIDGPDAAAEEEAPKKRKHAEPAEDMQVEEAPKKKKKEAVVEEVPVVAVAQPEAKTKKKKDERQSGVPFSRVDDAKWRATITDARLIDNTHEAKVKFGGGETGDSWGDAASADLLKTKGKGFRKEMAKKKRASWRGGGEIDQGVNSIKFAGSSDDE